MKKFLIPAFSCFLSGLIPAQVLTDAVYVRDGRPVEYISPHSPASGDIMPYIFKTYGEKKLPPDKQGPLNLNHSVYFDMPALWKQRGLRGEKEEYVPQHLEEMARSIRFYLDTALISYGDRNESIYKTIPDDVHKRYAQPFYFRKYEVSNNEYRQFVNWVRDSIAHEMLGHKMPGGLIDWKKEIKWEDSLVLKKLQPMFLPENLRFYRRRQIDASKMIYRFTPACSEAQQAGLAVLGIYPDTTTWMDDFTYYFQDPMTNHYYWHPAYDRYPVVGVSWWQTMAYLDWLTVEMQKEADREGKNTVVRCALPSEAEWEIVSGLSTDEKGNMKIFTSQFSGASDYSWITDLGVKNETRYREARYRGKMTDGSDTLLRSMRPDEAFLVMNNGQITPGNLITDGYFQTAPCDLVSTYRGKEKIQAFQQTDITNGFCCMGSNVSEWMRDDYTQWKPAFEKHADRLELLGGEDAQLALAVERYYFKQLPPGGKLVRGANWHDERYGFTLGKNTAGMNAKTFVKPDAKHCTLGFRYVVYVTPK
ncbi:MAG: hypothetical protein FD123_3950 [Bacteroidetes bacterium]|nr:MAG: hypothetical protein FD123_3950 [Bacteroidota bacterium]